jgi:probable F420-dependent oxidoreductase
VTNGWKRAGRFGVWATDFRFGEEGFVAEAAAELEELGYGAIWFPGGRGGDLLARISFVLGATSHCVIATGILNIWMHEPAEIGAWWKDIDPAQKQRVMLGLGVGHAPAIGDAWRQPLKKMSDYLDGLDDAGVPAQNRCIAALGPKMLDLARDRSAGAHPYLVPPEHTSIARERLSGEAWLAPEQGVILDRDPVSARAKAREQLATYARLPNYRNSWARLGFTEQDIDALSDRLVDALFVWGSPEHIGERLSGHLRAGADHVCLQVILGAVGSSDPATLQRIWRELAPSKLELAR